MLGETKHLPKSKDAAVFEALCRDVLNSMYHRTVDDCFELYAGKGESDFGTDIRGVDLELSKKTGSTKYILAQCKNYLADDDKKDDKLKKLIRSDVAKADEKYDRMVSRMYIMTAKNRTRHLQDLITELQGDYEFTIEIKFWDDLESAIFADKKLLKKYYPEYSPENVSANTQKRVGFLPSDIQICEALSKAIESINFFFEDYADKEWTPVEAEVELTKQDSKHKRYDNLLECLQKNKSDDQIFLVLGDPGSGKSMALRKYCRDWLKSIIAANDFTQIPLYINLKNWNKPWTNKYGPKNSDIFTFVKEYFLHTLEIENPDERNKYLAWFEERYHEGGWYFVFDSFDELPCLMGKEETYELIRNLSHTVYQFLEGSAAKGGILASRYFHQPTEDAENLMIINLQPFDDYRVQHMIKEHLPDADTVIKELFSYHEPLVAIGRNPLLLSLLILFIQKNPGKFPVSQMEMYENLVTQRLKANKGRIEEDHLTEDAITFAAMKLAEYMQNHVESGRECDYRNISIGTYGKLWPEIADILERMRLCKHTKESHTLSFVHRRFQEYFYVINRIRSNLNFSPEDYESIMGVSGLRDALVLYSEVAPKENASAIAAYCSDVIEKRWSFADNIHHVECVELVNTLTFMQDAFRNRKEVIREYEEGLFDKVKTELLLWDFQRNGYILEEEEDEVKLNAKEQLVDYVVLTALARCIFLFEGEHQQELINLVFRLNDRWLNDIILQDARNFKRLDNKKQIQILDTYARQTDVEFFKKFKNNVFTFSTSKSFRLIAEQYQWMAVQRVFFWIYSLGVFLASFTTQCFRISQEQHPFSVYRNVLSPFYHLQWSVKEYLNWGHVLSPESVLIREGLLILFEIVFVFAFLRYLYSEIARASIVGDCNAVEEDAVVFLGKVFFSDKVLRISSFLPLKRMILLLVTFMGIITWDFGFFFLLLLILLVMTRHNWTLFYLMNHGNKKKTKRWVRKKFKEFTFEAFFLVLIYSIFVLLFYVILMFIVRIGGNSAILSKIGTGFLYLFYLFYGVCLFVVAIMLLYFLCRKVRDYLRYRKLPKNVKSISRVKLEENLESLENKKYMISYLKQLRKNKCELTGEWLHQYRPDYDDSDVAHYLAELDSQNLSQNLARHI